MKYGLFLLLTIIHFSCRRESTSIVDPGDYDRYLSPVHHAKDHAAAAAELSFWENRGKKNGPNPVDLGEMAKAHFAMFRMTGKVRHLVAGDSLLKTVSSLLGDRDPDILFALTQSAITRHRFPEAAAWTKLGSSAGGDPYVECLLQFDTDMELGKYKSAGRMLHRIAGKPTFDLLLRKARWEDHQGDLATAITYMEEAACKVKSNPVLYGWASSNLADMYGHAGKIEAAYRTYLDVLSLDPGNTHALKGIAWVAYSHDRNLTEAKRILQHIISTAPDPEVFLVLAEIAEWEGNEKERKTWEDRFINTVDQPGYGGMYNKYLVGLFADRPGYLERAKAMAESELDNRTTPETWSWLAWVLYRCGEYERAGAIMNNHVVRQTFEPEILYRAALVYAAGGNQEETARLLRTCKESAYELGPVTTAQIEERLEQWKQKETGKR